jgi:hypothetical protein
MLETGEELAQWIRGQVGEALIWGAALRAESR